MADLSVLKSELSELVTALANPEDRTARTMTVDLLEELNDSDLDWLPADNDHERRLRLRARLLLLVYGNRIESRKKAGI